MALSPFKNVLNKLTRKEGIVIAGGFYFDVDVPVG